MTLVPSGSPPLHIAILPDGGRRWASQHGVSLNVSYDRTVSLLFEVALGLLDRECNHVSILLSGYRNHRLRTSDEVRCMNTHVKSFALRCIQHVGGTNECAVELYAPQDIASEVGITPGVYGTGLSKPKAKTLSLFVGYDPVTELQDAIVKSLSTCGEATRFTEHLCVTRPVDLVVRTGGFHVLSGFLPLATGYARLVFLEKLFNDLDLPAFCSVVDDFLRIPRHYGE